MQQLDSFKDLFVYLLSDVYNIETQIVTHLPQMAKMADSADLKEALTLHLEETREQVKRLDRIFKELNTHPEKVFWSPDIKNVFNDISAFVKGNEPSPLLDAAIIAMATRIEHVEIATYESLVAYACVLEAKGVEKELKETLKEEEKACSKLTKLAKGGLFTTGINAEATRNL